jgi:hypothetical protein
MVELWNSGDLEAWLDEIGPDFEFTPDPSFPDAGVYKGEDLREWMRAWSRTWEDNRFEMASRTGPHGWRRSSSTRRRRRRRETTLVDSPVNRVCSRTNLVASRN